VPGNFHSSDSLCLHGDNEVSKRFLRNLSHAKAPAIDMAAIHKGTGRMPITPAIPPTGLPPMIAFTSQKLRNGATTNPNPKITQAVKRLSMDA
jgi:hypothetical protein